MVSLCKLAVPWTVGTQVPTSLCWTCSVQTTAGPVRAELRVFSVIVILANTVKSARVLSASFHHSETQTREVQDCAQVCLAWKSRTGTLTPDPIQSPPIFCADPFPSPSFSCCYLGEWGISSSLLQEMNSRVCDPGFAMLCRLQTGTVEVGGGSQT